jgi:hypothetical protein
MFAISRPILYMLRPQLRPANGAGHRIKLPAHAVGVSRIAKPASPSHFSYPAALPGPTFPPTGLANHTVPLDSGVLQYVPFSFPAATERCVGRAAPAAERVWIPGTS